MTEDNWLQRVTEVDSSSKIPDIRPLNPMLFDSNPGQQQTSINNV